MTHLSRSIWLSLWLIVGFSVPSIAQNLYDPNTSITWLGIDFTRAQVYEESIRLVTVKLPGIFQEINQVVVDEPGKFAFRKFLHKKAVPADLSAVTQANAVINPKQVWEGNPSGQKGLSVNDLLEIVRQYDTGARTGIGFVVIMESMDRSREAAVLWLTFFDLKSKDIVFAEKRTGEPGGGGVRNYWANAVFHVLERLQLKKYEPPYPGNTRQPEGFVTSKPGTTAHFGAKHPCDNATQFPLADTTDTPANQLAYYESYRKNCPDNPLVYGYMADVYYRERENAGPDWLKSAIRNYELALRPPKYRLDTLFELLELQLLDARWKLANVLEYAGFYEQAIPYYNALKKYSPAYMAQREKEIRAQYGTAAPVRAGINYAEEALAHATVCRFLLKNRPASAAATLEKDTVVTPALIERMDFSEQAIGQRSGFEPVRSMVEEVEKQQQYKTKDPDIKGKIIDVALLGLSWALAPKGMQVEQRNQFIMGTLSAVVSLLDKDKVKVSAGGLSSGSMLGDLAGLKTSPVAKKAEAAFGQVEVPKGAAPADTKKVETAGGATITDSWNTIDVTGDWECIDCEGGGGVGTKDYGTTSITTHPMELKVIDNTVHLFSKVENRFSGLSNEYWVITPGHSITECSGSATLSENKFVLKNMIWKTKILQKSETKQIKGPAMLPNLNVNIPLSGVSEFESLYEIINSSEIKFKLLSSASPNPTVGKIFTLKRIK